MTLCILKLVAVSFAGWFYHPLSEEGMEILLILVCQLKLRESPIILSLAGGREGCTPDWWYLGCLLQRAWSLGLGLQSHETYLTSPFHVVHPVWSCWTSLNDRRALRRGRRSSSGGGGGWQPGVPCGDIQFCNEPLGFLTGQVCWPFWAHCGECLVIY